MAARRFGPEFHEPAEDDATDEFACPAPDCDRVFDSEKGRNVHHGVVHPDRIRDPVTCQYCGDEFHRKYDTANTYCSRECSIAARRNRATFDCEQCGTTVEMKASRAEQRRFCSAECHYEHQTRGDVVECAACGRQFHQKPSFSHRRCCSRACAAERQADRPRPDDPTMLVWLLYVYEGHNQRETWLRANAARDPDHDRITQRDVSGILHDNGWNRGPGGAKYEGLTLADVGLDETEAGDTADAEIRGGWS